jgi:hypothetical protein
VLTTHALFASKVQRRIIARKTGAQVRLYSRSGNDLTHRFPLIVGTLARLRARSWYHGARAGPYDGGRAARFGSHRKSHRCFRIYRPSSMLS